MEFNLKKVIQALLISTSEPIAARDIQDIFGRVHLQKEENPEKDLFKNVPSLITLSSIEGAIKEINENLEVENAVFRIRSFQKGYQIVIHPPYTYWVQLLRDEPPPLKLSQSALETLSIVAYRQPITRAEIDSIRGVSSDSMISKLQEHELIKGVGRSDLPGKPIQYGTTKAFLAFCDIASLEDLPSRHLLREDQIQKAICRQSRVNKDRDVGLPTEISKESYHKA